jgi:hypothetical protein
MKASGLKYYYLNFTFFVKKEQAFLPACSVLHLVISFVQYQVQDNFCRY